MSVDDKLCPSCREPLSYPSGDGCTNMTAHKERAMSDETCCGACGYPVYATKESACDWCRQSADRIEALTAENKMLRGAVYIDDLTVTMQARGRSKAIEGIGRALDLLNADMVVEAKIGLRATLAEIKAP